MKNFTLKSALILCLFTLSSSLIAQRFTPTVDTYIDQTASRADKVENDENPHKLVIRKATNQERITFFEFNIGDYSEQVSKAELCIYMFNTNATNSTEEIEVYEVLTGDITNGITWNNFTGNYTLSDEPVSTLVVTTGETLSASYTWYRLDVKSVINTLAAQNGSDKKVKLALKAKTSGLLLNFYSNEATSAGNNYPHYRPFLILTVGLPDNFVEKSRVTAAQDGYVYSGAVDAKYDEQRLYVNYYKSGDSKQYRYTNLRFNIPSETITDKHRVRVKTKVYAEQSGLNPVYVVDMLAMPNISDDENVNNLTWNTMPVGEENYTYLCSYFSSVDDKTNEADVEWDVTEYVKAQQLEGKTSVTFSLQVPELGGYIGHNLAFYARNFLNAEPGSDKVPQIILYEQDMLVGIDNPNTIDGKYVILKNDILSVNAVEELNGVVYSIQGKAILNVQNAASVDVSSFASGVYFLKLQDNSVFKFLKK